MHGSLRQAVGLPNGDLCPNCGAPLKFEGAGGATCAYCDRSYHRFAIGGPLAPAAPMRPQFQPATPSPASRSNARRPAPASFIVDLRPVLLVAICAAAGMYVARTYWTAEIPVLERDAEVKIVVGVLVGFLASFGQLLWIHDSPAPNTRWAITWCLLTLCACFFLLVER